jgi:hypothetical protein
MLWNECVLWSAATELFCQTGSVDHNSDCATRILLSGPGASVHGQWQRAWGTESCGVHRMACHGVLVSASQAGLAAAAYFQQLASGCVPPATGRWAVPAKCVKTAVCSSDALERVPHGVVECRREPVACFRLVIHAVLVCNGCAHWLCIYGM